MKNQRDHLLDILASGMPFKCEITLGFDVMEEGLMTDMVPRDAYNEALRKGAGLGAKVQMLQGRIELAQKQIGKMQQEAYEISAKKDKVKAEKPCKKADISEKPAKPKAQPKPVAVAPDKLPARGGPKRRWLTDQEVWDVRRFLKKKGWDALRISAQLGIKSVTIARIRSGRAYSKVPPEPVAGETKVHVGHGVMVGQR